MNNTTNDDFVILPSRTSDLPAITAIYAYHVLNATGTFETTPPSQEEMEQRRDDVLAKDLPFLVAYMEGQLVGFAYANWFKPRPAFRFSAEDSIYLAEGYAGRGLGKLLLQALIKECQASGVRKLIAVIGDSQNRGSIGVHRACGFTDAGLIRACGWKFERWLDIVLMEKSLGQGDNSPPLPKI